MQWKTMQIFFFIKQRGQQLHWHHLHCDSVKIRPQFTARNSKQRLRHPWLKKVLVRRGWELRAIMTDKRALWLVMIVWHFLNCLIISWFYKPHIGTKTWRKKNIMIPLSCQWCYWTLFFLLEVVFLKVIQKISYVIISVFLLTIQNSY